jgi:hypothetical protein
MKKNNSVKADVSRSSFSAGQKVKIIDDKGIPDYVKDMGFKKGKIFTIREIAEKDFNGDGGGLRLSGITLYSDLTGFEKAFNRKRFELVRGGK